jgi:hypothetical protein
MDLLQEMDNKTGDLIGLLSCVSGMPMVIKSNLATELGICNGTRCTLSRIIFHPEQIDFDPKSQRAEALFIDYKTQPLMILVKIANPRFKQFVGLAKDEFPIFPSTSSFDYKYYVEGKRVSTRVNRSQFPLLPGYALTGYAAQGGTFEKAVLDLTTPTGKGVGAINKADSYVLLSRMKTRSGLLILRRFDEIILARKPDRDMIAEIKRLEALASRCIATLSTSGLNNTISHLQGGSPKKRQQQQKQHDRGSPKKKQRQLHIVHVHECRGKCEDPCLLKGTSN